MRTACPPPSLQISYPEISFQKSHTDCRKFISLTNISFSINYTDGKIIFNKLYFMKKLHPKQEEEFITDASLASFGSYVIHYPLKRQVTLCKLSDDQKLRCYISLRRLAHEDETPNLEAQQVLWKKRSWELQKLYVQTHTLDPEEMALFFSNAAAEAVMYYIKKMQGILDLSTYRLIRQRPSDGQKLASWYDFCYGYGLHLKDWWNRMLGA